MNPADLTSLNEEIKQMLAEMSMPKDVRAVLQQGVQKLKENGMGQGLREGEKAPDFLLPNLAGEKISLSQKLAQGPVVVKFIRGEWCPICNLDVAALNRIVPELNTLGASLLVINPQKPDRGAILQSKHKLGFDILSDERQDAVRAFKLQFTVPLPVQQVYQGIGLDLTRHTADGSWNLPVPATFVLDRKGVIRARHVDVNYMQRMEPTAIIEAIRSLL